MVSQPTLVMLSEDFTVSKTSSPGSNILGSEKTLVGSPTYPIIKMKSSICDLRKRLYRKIEGPLSRRLIKLKARRIN